MFDRLSAYLAQPYPVNNDSQHYLKVVVIFAVFVAGFLMVFRPFGLDDLPGLQVIWVALSFGLVTLVLLMISLLVKQVFPNEFQDERWTLGKEIGFGVFNFFAVGNGNFVFVRYGWFSEYLSFEYGSMMFATLTVGFFPYLFMLLIQHMAMLNKNLKEADAMTQTLGNRIERVKTSYELYGENEGEYLCFDMDDLLFVASSGNYIEVVLKAEGHLRKEVIRSTLSSVEEVLASSAFAFRCHRTYLVNLDQVKTVSGNSQGYRLVLDGLEDEIPVARTKSKAFKAALALLNA